jgi:transcriptional regulator with XRE-family HTH domain
VATVHHWTGREARALRLALRMTVRGFAEHLGVGVRTVSKWEQLLTATEPRPESQAILDTALARAEAAVHLRLETSLSRAGGDAAGPRRRTTVARPLAWEYESWTDDLDRVVVSLSRQDFPLADDLLHRWLGAFSPLNLDQRGLYLYARSTTLLGDLRRDQGSLLGPLSAHHSYSTAHGLFSQLGIPRRLAQTELLLALLNEMSWNLDAARGQYERLADDERLSRRDRARSRLWMGRALSKAGDYERAIALMTHAAREFEDLGEPDHWSVAQQKIALALRGCGDLTRAFRHIEVARSVGRGDSPLQRVRLSTAHAHILLSDPATRDEGRSVLHGAARVADAYGLGHQLTSIENIRRTGGESPTARARESAG